MSYSASTGAAAVVFLVHVCNSVCPSVKLSYTLSSMTHGCWSLFCCCVSTKVTKKQLSNFQYRAWKSYQRLLFGRFFELFKNSSISFISGSEPEVGTGARAFIPGIPGKFGKNNFSFPGKFGKFCQNCETLKLRKIAIVLLSYCLHFENSAKSKPMRRAEKWRFSVQL